MREPALTPLRADLAALLERSGGVMTPPEIAEALLLTRGSVQNEPERTRRALAVARAAVEAERFVAKPRYQLRRDEGRVFVAREPALEEYAARLGDAADRIAAADPLLPPDRALEQLRLVTPPPGAERLSDARLMRLAAAAAHRAALSGRQELYPRAMDPLRALKLSQGALYGVSCLSVGQIVERVSSRYPHAAPLPPRPALDDLLREAGFDFAWDPERRPQGVEERGCYVTRQANGFSVSTGSESRTRNAGPLLQPGERGTREPEDSDARYFEERLRRSLREGAFLALVVSPGRYSAALRQLEARFPVEIVDLDALLIAALRRTAEAVKARWDVVLKADAAPGQGDWSRLMLLVERAMPEVEQRLAAPGKPLLIVYAGLLARYDRMALLERLRDRAGRRDGPGSVWLLVPGDEEARIDGRAVPLLGPGQRIRIPETWLAARQPEPAPIEVTA